MPNCNSDIGKALRSAMAASLKAWHHWDIKTAIGVAVGFPERLKMIDEVFDGKWDDVPTDESVKIKEVYEAVRSAVYEKRTLKIAKKRRAAGHAEFLARIMPDFYKENESYDFYEEVCFDPKEFILWLKNEKIVKISPVFQVFHDDDFGCVWLDEPFPNGAVTELDPKYFTDYHYYIRLPYWTLAEAACLLSKLSPDVMGAIEAEPYHMLPTETAARLDNKRRCEEIIKRACYLGTLDYFPEGDEDGGAYCFRPLTLLNWAKDAGIDIPDILCRWAKGTHGYANENQITTELNILKKRKPKQKTIPTPPKTQWHQVHFRIVSPARIEITTPDGMEPYHSDDLGFTKKIWDQFERFAAEGVEYIKEEKTDIYRLRTLLKTVFPGVEGDPIPHEKNKGYKAEFHITEA